MKSISCARGRMNRPTESLYASIHILHMCMYTDQSHCLLGPPTNAVPDVAVGRIPPLCAESWVRTYETQRKRGSRELGKITALRLRNPSTFPSVAALLPLFLLLSPLRIEKCLFPSGTERSTETAHSWQSRHLPTSSAREGCKLQTPPQS